MENPGKEKNVLKFSPCSWWTFAISHTGCLKFNRKGTIKPSDKVKKTPEQSETSCSTRDNVVLLQWKELFPGPAANTQKNRWRQSIWRSSRHEDQVSETEIVWACVSDSYLWTTSQFGHLCGVAVLRGQSLVGEGGCWRLYMCQQDSGPCYIIMCGVRLRKRPSALPADLND